MSNPINTPDTEYIAVLAQHIRAHLCEIVAATPITYQALAQATGVTPPNTIHQITVALEYLMEQDATASRPLISALVISKARGGLPAVGFFDCAQRIGRFQGDLTGPDANSFFTAEFSAATKYWQTPSTS